MRPTPCQTGTAHADAPARGCQTSAALSEGVSDASRELVECLTLGVAMFDADARLVTCNGQYAALYGLSVADLTHGTPLCEIIDQRIRIGVFAGASPEAYRAAKLARDDKPECEVERLSDGRSMLIRRRVTRGGGWVTMHEDVSERFQYEAKISHLASHDCLTDLPNRHLLASELERALDGAGRGGTLALHWIDLDRFKRVNDTYGHPVGDAVLQEVARRLTATVRGGDTVARLGGDEFAVLQVPAPSKAAADALSRRIIDAMKRPFECDGSRFVLGCSIGVAMPGIGGETADALMQMADQALYEAKEHGRCQHRFFDSTLERKVSRRKQIEGELARAIVRDELELHYQPIVDLQRRRVCRFEALLRWNHPTRGLVGPADFIPVAEETGLIVAIGDWVLKQACADAAAWPDDLAVSVNLSALQFKQGGPAHAIRRALEASGLAVARLECEITESAIIDDVAEASAILQEIATLGVRVSLDDFGTGYSSLSSLSHFQLDGLKIDRSFVANITTVGSPLAILRTIARLGEALDLETTVEGVETVEQLAIACREGCRSAQGFLFSRPLPVERALASVDGINALARHLLTGAASTPNLRMMA